MNGCSLSRSPATAPPGRAGRPGGVTWAILGLLALATLAAVLYEPPLYLELRSYPAEDLLLAERVTKGDTFATRIIHSVHLSPVYEYYRIEDAGKIVLEATRLQDLGWGVPSTFTYPYRIEGGFMVIESIEKELPCLPFRVSHINAPRLFLGKMPGRKDIDLEKYAPDGKRITFRVTRGRSPADLFRSLYKEG